MIKTEWCRVYLCVWCDCVCFEVRKELLTQIAHKKQKQTFFFETKKTHTHTKGSPNNPLKFPCLNAGLRKLSEIGVLCNESSLQYKKDATLAKNIHWSVTGEPTEGALKVMAEKIGLPDSNECLKYNNKPVLEKYNLVDKYWNHIYKKEEMLEFSRERKSMSVFVKTNNNNDKMNNGFLMVKGAPEEMLERSIYIFCESDEKIYELTENMRKKIKQIFQDYAKQGLRCLAMGYKEYKNKEFNLKEETQKIEHGLNPSELSNDSMKDVYRQIETQLIFVGIVAMLDPPKPEVKQAIETCNLAGIRVIVITGDNKQTAEAICREIGLFNQQTTEQDLKELSYTGFVFFYFIFVLFFF